MNIDLTADGARFLEALIEASRAIGTDDTLTLHGGGNTSVKVDAVAPDGSAEPALLVKGSGHDLATIGAGGFAALQLGRLRALLGSSRVSQENLMAHFHAASLDVAAPQPSVETLVHVALPHRFVLHSHSDAVQSITDTPAADALPETVWDAERVALLDYAMPGVPLGEAVRCEVASWDARAVAPEAIVVRGHGVFAFADTAEEALAAHGRVVEAAVAALARAGAATGGEAAPEPASDPRRIDGAAETSAGRANDTETAIMLAELRAEVSRRAGFPMILTRHQESAANAVLGDAALATAVQRGPVTPDHVTWLGPRVSVEESVEKFGEWYDEYVHRNAERRRETIEPAFGFPRAMISQRLGVVTAGRSPEESAMASDLLEHTVAIVRAAESIGGYEPASQDHVFDLEYWRPQREKFQRRDPAAPDAGRIVLVTGAASGIGRAIAETYLDRGACVIGWDRSEGIVTTFDSARWLGQIVDVSDEEAQRRALAEAVDRFGGLDMLVPAAGIFPAAAHIDELDPVLWERSMSINVSSSAILFRLAYPLLRHAVDGGNVCVIASKNVAAPGPGAAAYSASKAALTQLSRVAALEWAGDDIRVNMVHPDAVFDTALWTPELLAQRAEHYGMSVDDYKRRNLLRAEVTSRKVGNLVATMTSPVFGCTTGAQVPIDGGNERVI